MDRFPCELFRHILQYVDQPFDLLRMSHVCRHWRVAIMSDEFFLNKWFSRSLKRSRKSYFYMIVYYRDGCKISSKLNRYQSLFPSGLRSSKCDFLPWLASRNLSGYQTLYEYGYHVSLCDSSHSFSFWLFLPDRCELYIQVGNRHDKDLEILLRSDEHYHTHNQQSFSIANRWIHVVLTKIDGESNYRICIDGRVVTSLQQTRISLGKWQKQSFWLFNFLLCRTLASDPLEISSQARLADFNAFKRCLTLVEIRAIHQQQVPIKQVKVGTYINSD